MDNRSCRSSICEVTMNDVNWQPFGGEEFSNITLTEAERVILPLCYENAPSYGIGSASGAFHILTASSQIELIDEENRCDWSALNIHTRPPLFPCSEPETAMTEIAMAAEEILNTGKFLLCLGGDHAISIGAIAAAARRFPDLGVLQIDAHADLRNEWNNSRYNHACVMRRVVEDLGLPVVQVGIRSVSREELEFIQAKGLNPYYAHEICCGKDDWIQKAVAQLPNKVYLTVDLDGLDPSVIPGTGTPEPGGLTYRQLLSLIKYLGRKKQVVAADINELAKIPGNQVSEVTAAKIAVKILIYCSTKP